MSDDASTALSITRDENGTSEIFVLQGDIDIASSMTLREELLRAAPAGDEHLVVDLSGVGFMDSSGLAALVGAWKAVRDQGSFRIAGPNAAVTRVLTITGMEDVFEIHPDLASAVAR